MRARPASRRSGGASSTPRRFVGVRQARAGLAALVLAALAACGPEATSPTVSPPSALTPAAAATAPTATTVAASPSRTAVESAPALAATAAPSPVGPALPPPTVAAPEQPKPPPSASASATPAPPTALAVPTPRTLPAGLRGYGIQGEFRRADAGTLGDLVANAGLNWVKQQVPWRDVERAPGKYYWTELDNLVQSMQARGLSILFSVVKAPDFFKEPALRGSAHGPPADAAHFRTFMRALVGRYVGRVQAYEIWNEQNLAREWGAVDDTAYGEFLELLKQGYLAVKEIDPNAIVVMGALTPTGVNDPKIAVDDLTYLKRLLALNQGEAGRYFEALGVHPNGGANAPDDTRLNPAHSKATCNGGWANHDSFFFNRYAQLYQALLDAGVTGKTVWMTEFGWAVTAQPAEGYEYARCNSENDQAGFITRAFEKVRAETPYVTHLFIWNLNFQQIEPATDEKWAFGIVRKDLSGRPAYAAVRAMPKPQP